MFSEFVPTTETFSWPPGKRMALSLTFDDARPTQLESGVPVLNELGVNATFYLFCPNVEVRREAWRAAAAKGHEMGNHSLTHPCSGNFSFAQKNALEDFTLERMEQELLVASQKLQELLNITPKTFAYPCGQTFVGRGTHVKSYVPLIAKHFLAGRGWLSERHNVPGFCDLAQLYGCSFDRLTFDQMKPMLDTAAAEGGWLVLAGHDTGHDDRHQMVRIDTLRELCAFATDPKNGIWIDTVATISEFVRNKRTSAPEDSSSDILDLGSEL
ncbi:MAG: polysaccharide deacetylase family protein [Candidatus Hydrogenedentes bacterium]|nr:polysaccharide deacetylase family protein [Candidatus Hydrogenedentota bacterium]